MDKAQYLKAAELQRGAVGGEFTFNHKVPKYTWYSFYQPQKEMKS